jgi:hypothetical protein
MSAELAKLMRTDANVAQLLKSITAALPPGAILSDVSMIMNSSGGTNRSGAASVGKPAVATMTLTGTAAHLADVAKFVDNLAAIPGVQAPFPGSDTVAPDGAHFNISLSLDTSVLSHRFDVKGAK